MLSFFVSVDAASAALGGSPSWASYPSFSFGRNTDPEPTHIKASTCSTGVWDSIASICVAACLPDDTCTDHAAEIANTCVGSDYVISDNGCGVQQLCSGTRSCDYNWKEVAP